jgi:hypothetical protein
MNLASDQQGKSLYEVELLRASRGLINPCARKSHFESSKNSMAIIRKAQCTDTQSVLKTLRRPRKGGKNVLRAGCNSPPAVIARNAHSPRALGADTALVVRGGKVSRPGVIPGPTVIVRMKRERD